MANAQEVIRLYNDADADLVQETDDIIDTATRDLADLTPRGLSVAKITSLKQARDTFSNFPTDEELRADVTVAAAAKDATRTTLETTVADIRGIANNKYKGKGRYKSFGFNNPSTLSDNKMVRMARRVTRVAITLQPQMTAEGLTPAIITNLRNQTDAFDNAIETVGAAEETRDLNTQDRIEAGNALYTQLVDIANIGKAYYQTRDEAKYNDYVLNPAPTGGDGPAIPDNPNA